MLFQRLYNWLKYKNFPVSFLAKNRFFIEKDSRLKRIYINFGLIFKNSKWTNLEIDNIKFSFLNFFLIKILFLIIFFSFFIKFYITIEAYNSFFFIFWLIFDSTVYYISFIIWIITSFFSILWGIVNFYLFNINLDSRSDRFDEDKNSESLSYDYNNSLSSTHVFSIEKINYKWFLYLWLKHNKNDNAFITDNLEKVFYLKINKMWWDENYNFFLKLYKLIYLIKNFNLSFLKLYFFYWNKKNKNNFIRFNLFESINYYNFSMNYNSIYFWYILNRFSSDFDSLELNSTQYLFNRYNWNLEFLNNELKVNKDVLNFQVYLFYNIINSFSSLYSNYYHNSEYLIFFKLIQNHLKIVKWNRWLYKYSIFHKNILKNVQSFNIIKNYFNQSYFKNLLEIDELFLNKINFNSYYNFKIYSKINNFNIDSLDNTNYALFSSLNNMFNRNDLIKFFDYSYFWFIKKNYFFNTLKNNKIEYNVSLNNQFNNLNNEVTDDLSLNYNVLINFYSINYNLNNYNLNNYNLNNYNLNNYNLNNYNLNNYNLNNYNLKDLYLHQSLSDMFNYSNLINLIWLTSSPLNHHSVFFFFSFFNSFNSNNFINYRNSSFLTLYNKNYEFNKYLVLSIIDINFMYKNDLYYFTFF